MFTVKATYRNETRRFSFPDSVLFPTFSDIHNQLCRLFPISHGYYLSGLIFSPDASKPGRILVGRQVHSADDYDSCVAPLRRVWPKPLLRFTVFHESVPSLSPGSERLSLYYPPPIPLSEATDRSPTPVNSCILPPNSLPLTPPPLPPPAPPLHSSASCILSLSPPPTDRPIILSPVPNEPCSVSTAETASCCSVTKGKMDMQVLLSSFKDDLGRILHETFGSGHVEQRSPSPKGFCVADAVASQVETPSRWCFVCRTSFSGVWYGCVKCPWHAVCPSCFSKSHSAHTLSFGPSHVVQQRSTDCSTKVSPPVSAENKWTPPGSSVLAGEPRLPTHRGVICDRCNKTIVGVRHKCLDCPDYDLCTTCMESGATEHHNPFHEFFDIETPGRVHIHTVLAHDRAQSPPENRVQVPSPSDSQVVQQSITPELPVRHSAACNLCDSEIIGDRYKCLVCPDFDTCSSCFGITEEQHPNHGFVKVSKPDDLLMRDCLPLRPVAHLAVCDSCDESIRGARYKCMHPSCPDFDLCSDCEALPIPVHPLNHPMLKIKTPETVIPTVYRIGQTRAIDVLSHQSVLKPPSLFSRSPPANTIKSPELMPVVSDNASGVAVEDQAPVTEEFLSPLGSPINNVPGELPCAGVLPPCLIGVTKWPESPRPTQPLPDIYCQLWPKVNQEMMHLIATQVPRIEGPIMENSITELGAHQRPVAETPELARTVPGAGERQWMGLVSPVSGAKSIADDYRTPSPVLSIALESPHAGLGLLGGHVKTITDTSKQGYLDSALVGDSNVPDGQVFPPGAEFVKGWRMVNNGGVPWPATTEIQFVAGEKFTLEGGVSPKAKVGVVLPGHDFDIWTGDLKAPDVPGRYVGYWRLNDGQGNFFGSSVWIDLIVADHHSDQASEDSLAASSVIMPSAHPTHSVDVSDGIRDALRPSLTSTETAMDDVESDISSVSLVSAPTSDDEDAEWQDTRTHSGPLEYVVLYDDNSEE